MLNVLKVIESNPIKLQSNFARYNALLIAAAASEGFISNIDSDKMIVNTWRITIKGLIYLDKGV
jgi:hypothetical protein